MEDILSEVKEVKSNKAGCLIKKILKMQRFVASRGATSEIFNAGR